MKNGNETQNGKGTVKDLTAKKAVEAKKGNETKKDKEAPKSTEAKKPTINVEELVKENEELKKKLATVPTDLAEKISFFQRKQELISKLEFLKENERALLVNKKRLDELSEEDEFSNEEFELSLVHGNYHNKQEVFTFKNPVVLGEVIEFMLGRVKVKKEHLEVEINA